MAVLPLYVVVVVDMIKSCALPLPHPQELTLCGNDLEGALPDAWSTLTHLTVRALCMGVLVAGAAGSLDHI